MTRVEKCYCKSGFIEDKQGQSLLGDIAGTSFVNISTRDSKKDIEYITEESKSLILDTIGDIKIAKYRYNQEDETAPLRLGLIAEEAPLEVLSASGKGVDIYKLATFTLAGVQELDLEIKSLASTTPEVGSLGERLITNIITQVKGWLASAGNGIGSIFAQTFRASEEICIDDQCLDREDVVALLALVNESQQGGNGNGGQATSTPPVDSSLPVITVLGDNPAIITVGTSYVDLGATVTDTNADGSVNNNLGLFFNVNGIDMAEVSVDTSATSTNVVIYSAVDGAGNWGYATRTVEVIPQ